MSEQIITLQAVDDTPHARQARQDLAALDGARVTEPDEVGVFEVHLEADHHEDAVKRVIDAIAAAGADDHLLVAEHPDRPRHWEREPDV